MIERNLPIDSKSVPADERSLDDSGKQNVIDFRPLDLLKDQMPAETKRSNMTAMLGYLDLDCQSPGAGGDVDRQLLQLVKADSEVPGKAQPDASKGAGSDAPVRRELDFNYQRLTKEKLSEALTGKSDIVGLKVGSQFLTDDVFAAMKGLTNLEKLNLRGSIQVKGSGLEHLKESGNLQSLDLGYTDLRSDSLKHLQGKTNLQELLLDHTRVTDAGLKHVETLSSLKTLNLSSSRITDSGLSNLASLSKLENLDLSGNSITDDGLGKLKGLSNLKYINLGSTAIGDEGVEQHIAGMKELKHLYLKDSLVSDKATEHIMDMNLYGLNLSNTDITDSGLKNISQLKELRTLDLSDTKVTDSGIKSLSALKYLKDLNLQRLANRDSITDLSVGTLKQLTNLDQLNLIGTGITKAGLQELQKALPNCKIHANAY